MFVCGAETESSLLQQGQVVADLWGPTTKKVAMNKDTKNKNVLFKAMLKRVDSLASTFELTMNEIKLETLKEWEGEYYPPKYSLNSSNTQNKMAALIFTGT